MEFPIAIHSFTFSLYFKKLLLQCADQCCTICFPDENECLVDNGGCEQICENTAGYFKCGCFEGYKLNVDHKTCDGKIYYSLNITAMARYRKANISL